MSRDSIDCIENPCPVTCPKVREDLRIAMNEYPDIMDGIFPRKKNDMEPRLPLDIISRDIRDESKQEFPITPEPTVISIKKIADDIEEKMDLIKKEELIQELTIVQEVVVPIEKIDRNEEKIALIKKEELIKKPAIVQEEVVTPIEKAVDRDEEKIALIKKEELIKKPAIVQEEVVALIEKAVDRDEEKIALIKKEELIKKPTIVQEEVVAPIEKAVDRDDEKIDSVEEKDIERIAVEPVKKVPIEGPEIIKEIERVPAAEIESEPSRELEKHLEPEEPMEYDEEEESKTDYEKYIDEELREFLPAVIAREIPEEPRAARHEISRNAATLYERIDRERSVRLPREREAVTAMPEERSAREEISTGRALENSTITEQTISRKPTAAEDACDEMSLLVKTQKDYIMCKLKERQRVVDHYYLTKGFSYFEDVCTCSLACIVYALSRNPFAKSIFESLVVFAVGLKLCSELDGWEMPSRIS